MKEKLVIKRVDNQSLWDDFVAASPQGTVFSTTEWLNAASSAQGGEPHIMGVWKEDQLIAGISFVFCDSAGRPASKRK